MAYAQVFCRAERGLEAPLVTVEVHLAGGLPCFNIVGLAATAVREARDRVRGALANCGFDFPVSRIVVNLAPADIPKHGGRFDLPIALGILAASGQLPHTQLADVEAFAELTLAGELRPVRGLLPACLATFAAGRRALVAAGNATEAQLPPGAGVLVASSLMEAVACLSGQARNTAAVEPTLEPTDLSPPDLMDVRGQHQAKRALEVAAVGGHHMLLIGPPGTGKSLLAARLPGILPPMTPVEAIEAACVESLVSGGSRRTAAVAAGRRLYRAPHHGASAVALIGGGSPPRPGEVTLAQHGVLFLDELPEFGRHTLDMLREPLEAGVIHLSRATERITYPARFQLIGAMNPCPCGYYGDSERECRCAPDQRLRYRARLSGPLLDRIDIGVTMPRVSFDVLTGPPDGDTSSTVRERVVAARERALARQGCTNGVAAADILLPTLEVAATRLLRSAASQLTLSARHCHRVLRAARSIADLADTDSIHEQHMAEALSLRLGLEEGSSGP